MKGKAPNTSVMNLKAYAGGDSNVAAESRNTKEAFKRGGKVHTDEAMDKALIKKMVKPKARTARKEGGAIEGVMSKAHAGRKPRKSGGGVFSSASAGTPRGKADHY